MRIVIVGAGQVGTQLAWRLIQEKHDVSLIESDEERARHASNRLDCMVIHDEGNSWKALEDAGILKAEALVCVTESDEVNMIICSLAASRHGNLLTIARVKNDDYVRLNRSGEQVMGISHFVHPDMEASRSVLDAIGHGALGDILSFANTSWEVGSITINADCPFDGLCIKDYHEKITGDSMVILVERNGECILPAGSTLLARGDRAHFLAREADMDHIFKLAGQPEKKPLRKIGIAGGGRTGTLIAEGLLERKEETGGSVFSFFRSLFSKTGRRLTIIEKDYALCGELAARFPGALVLNEDISDENFVAEEGIGDLDLIIAATEHQELNIITAVYLKSRGVTRTIAMVTGSGYAAIARGLGVDVVIPVKSAVVDAILSRLVGKGITGIHSLVEGSTSIIEIDIDKASPAVGTPLREYTFSKESLLVLVNRGENSFLPRGDYVMEGGDHVFVIVKKGSEAEIRGLFAPGA
ncbi:MAG: Trk system potassium transporter TrkA [Treponema sp.]|jgi:trk system potassium uptake protein TrkA|nr:Trk system potassium transporter TrkA [Treponema sp.]